MFRTLTIAALTAVGLSLVAPQPGSAVPITAPSAVEADDERINSLRTLQPRDEHRTVTVRGMLDRVLVNPAGNGTHIFQLRDEYGGTLRVRSAESVPDRRVLYELTGTVSVDRAGRVYLSEDARSIIPLGAVDTHTRTIERVAVIDGTAVSGGNMTQTAVAVQDHISPDIAHQEAGIPGWAWLLAGIGVGLIGLVAARIPGGGSPSDRGSSRRRPVTAPISPFSGEPVEGGRAGTTGATAAPAKGTAVAGNATPTRRFSPTVRVLPAWLERIDGKGQPIRFFAPPTGGHQIRISLGRDTGNPYEHVQLDEQTVSRRQAALNVLDGHYMLENLSGTNPTQVNGRPVGREPMPLSDGDLVQLGEMSLRFRIPEGLRA